MRTGHWTSQTITAPLRGMGCSETFQNGVDVVLRWTLVRGLLILFTHFTLRCYRIDAWAIRRPWLTFVNALTNSIFGRFYTARTQRFASCAWLMVLRKLRNRWKWKGESWFNYTGAFWGCCWNRRDVILFSVVRKITASRENRGKVLGDEVMKIAS